MGELTDEQIRKMAKARAAFKTHALVYVLVNLFLALLWLMAVFDAAPGARITYWPIWTHLGWGLGLAFHGFGAYGRLGPGMQAREEQRIREKLGR